MARWSVTPVDVRDAWRSRHSDTVEATAYFCCLECLQNAAKHAGAEASVTVRLGQTNGRVRFDVQDDGAGFDPAAERGRGLTNVADRLAAVGGTLAFPGRGTRISGDIPV